MHCVGENIHIPACQNKDNKAPRFQKMTSIKSIMYILYKLDICPLARGVDINNV